MQNCSSFSVAFTRHLGLLRHRGQSVMLDRPTAKRLSFTPRAPLPSSVKTGRGCQSGDDGATFVMGIIWYLWFHRFSEVVLGSRGQHFHIQGCTNRLFLGCVKVDEKVAFCLLTAVRRTHFFTPYSINLGRAFLRIPVVSQHLTNAPFT